jgi:prepilin peptidase CpaA
MTMEPTLPVSVGVVLAAVVVSAVTDVWKFKVHNVLTFPLLIGGLLFHGIMQGPLGLSGSLLGAAFGFCILIGIYILGGMGAGDVKLMTAVGAWLGLELTFYVFVASSLAAGIYAIALIVFHHRVAETWFNVKIAGYRLAALGRFLGTEQRVEAAVAQSDRRGRIIPFAAMIAFGVVATIWWVWLK